MRIVPLVLACVLSAPLEATVIIPADFREIVNGSDIIAYGRVVETAVDSADDRRQVHTLVTLQVGTYLKGGEGETLVFRVPGGQIGRYRAVMVGAPQFTVGEEAVVFLTAGDNGEPRVFGLNQGVFRVRLDAASGRRIVVPPTLMAGQASAPVVRGSVERRPLPLETFGGQVRAVIADAPAGSSR